MKRGVNPYFVFFLVLSLANVTLLCVLLVAPEQVSLLFDPAAMRTLAMGCLLVLGVAYGTRLASAGARKYGVDSRWDGLLRVLVPLVLAALLFVLRNGSFPFRLVYAEFLVSLSLLFPFPRACSFSSLALVLISLKGLYLGLPFDGFYHFSLLVLVSLFKFAFDEDLQHLCEQEKAVRQARIAAAELANTNIRLQESVFFSEMAIQVREKKRIAGELHDNIGHILTSLLLSVRNHKYLDDPSVQELREHQRDVERLIKNAIGEFRKEVYTLRDEAEMKLSWPLRWRKVCLVFSDCTGVRVHLQCQEDLVSIADDIGETVMKIIKEALNNSVRHGNASYITISVIRDTALRLLMLKISDNGIGASLVKPALGIQTMTERVKGLNGRIGWVTRPGKGFDLGVDLPLSPLELP